MGSFRELIIKCNDRFINWVVTRPLRREKDPQRRFEIKLWMEIKGSFLGGMDSTMSWVKYKSYYYDKLPTEDEKKRVREALLSMLKSSKHEIPQKALIAYVCADLEIKEALQDVGDLLQRAQDRSSKNQLNLALEALTRGIPVDKLIDEKFRRGERM